jgi:hypothetical protein
MKHVIEPAFSVEYLTEIANQARVPLTDSSVVAVGGREGLTYGLTNRLIARTRGTRWRTRLDAGIPDGRRAADVLHESRDEPLRHDLRQLCRPAESVDLSPIAVPPACRRRR